MRLVSLNAWGGQVWPALKDWVPSVGADILCLQEVTRAPVPSPEWLVYRDAYRELAQRSDLFADVSGLLAGFAAQFTPAARGPLQDASGTVFDSDHGIAFWSRRDVPIADFYQGFIHGSYRKDGWGPEPVPRAIQVVRSAASGGPFVFAHLHGLRDPSGKGDTPARVEQARAIVAAIDQLRQPGDAVILAGDFNLLPDSATFDMLSGVGLRDLVTTRGFTDTRTALYAKPQRFADYLLVTSGVTVRAFDVPGRPEVSDHRPLILDFDIP